MPTKPFINDGFSGSYSIFRHTIKEPISVTIEPFNISLSYYASCQQGHNRKGLQMKDLLTYFSYMPLVRISLQDVDIHIDYLHMESFSSYNVYYFKLYYKDNAPVPCIATSDTYTSFKLPIHFLLGVVFRYKTTLSVVRAMLMEFLDDGGRNSFSGFAVCCLLLRDYYVLRDLISDDDAETVYDMVTRKHLYTWYVNDDEMPAEYVTRLRVEYLPKDITLRAVPIPHEEPQPYNIRGYYAY